MKKKIAFIIVLCLLSIVNINASTVNEKSVNKKVSLYDLSTRANDFIRFAQSYIVTLAMSTVDEYGDIDENNCISFVALISKDIEFNIQANLLQPILDFKKFLSDNKGKKVKYIKTYKFSDRSECHYEVL